MGNLADAFPDAAHSDDADRFSRQFDMRRQPVGPIARALPVAPLYGIMMIPDMVANLEKQGEGKLRHGIGAVNRNIGNRDARDRAP